MASLLDKFSERPKSKTFAEQMRGKWNKKRLEREKLEKSVLERQKGLTGFLEGFSRICFTVGAEETSVFEREQASSKKQGLPYCSRFTKNMGKDDVVWLWYENSVDPPALLTEIQLTQAP